MKEEGNGNTGIKAYYIPPRIERDVEQHKDLNTQGKVNKTGETHEVNHRRWGESKGRQWKAMQDAQRESIRNKTDPDQLESQRVTHKVTNTGDVN